MVFTSKHLLNAPASLVTDALQGLTRINPKVQLDIQNKVLYQRDHDRSKVALICGGGAGHEPAHAGFVGKGVLTAAVSGNIFASPNSSQVLRAIDLVDTDTLIIIKNYTGDILNFGLAREKYISLHADRADRVKFLVVADDVSVSRSQGGLVGRRGLAGTVLVYKIAGALADSGAPLHKVHAVAEWVASRLGTIGAGLDHCHVPGTEVREGHLHADELEVGMGIHNESGYQRLSPIPPLKELIPTLLDLVVSTEDTERSFLPFSTNGGDSVVLLVNNLGGVSELELSAIAQEATNAVHARGLKLERVIVGTFMTSLNMPGFSLSLLLLPRKDEGAPATAEEILKLLDEPCDAPGWSWTSRAPPNVIEDKSVPSSEAEPETKRAGILPSSDFAAFDRAVRAACDAIIVAEPQITELDSIAGDGDCGLTLRSGAQGVLEQIKLGSISGKDVVGSIINIAHTCEACMDGTSGALYSIWFSALAQGLQSVSSDVAGMDVWTKALESALVKLYTYTPARAPSRTLVDPLDAFVRALSQGLDLMDAADVAGHATDATKDLPARAGRATYVESERLKGVIDPGALGLKVIFTAIAKAVKN